MSLMSVTELVGTSIVEFTVRHLGGNDGICEAKLPNGPVVCAYGVLDKQLNAAADLIDRCRKNVLVRLG